MNQPVFRLIFDIHDAISPIMLNLRQYNEGHIIKARLTENGKPYIITSECLAALYVKLPSGTIITDTDCTISNNEISVEILDTMTDEVGLCECEFRIGSTATNGADIQLPRFLMRVDASLVAEDEDDE